MIKYLQIQQHTHEENFKTLLKNTEEWANANILHGVRKYLHKVESFLQDKLYILYDPNKNASTSFPPTEVMKFILKFIWQMKQMRTARKFWEERVMGKGYPYQILKYKATTILKVW